MCRYIPYLFSYLLAVNVVKEVVYNVSVFVTNGRGCSAAVSKRVLSKETGSTHNCFIVKYFLYLSVPNGASTNSSPSNAS